MERSSTAVTPLLSRGLVAVLIAQFLSAFADNAILVGAIKLLMTLSREKGMDALLQGLERVQASNAAFLFIGSGVMQPDVEQFCAAHPRGHYLRSQAAFDRSALLATCDVALVCLQPGMFGLGPVPAVQRRFLRAQGRQ